MQVSVGQATKVDPPREHEVLFDGANAVILILQIVEAGDSTTQPTRSTRHQRTFKSASIASREEVAIGVNRAIQFAITDHSPISAGCGGGQQGWPEVSEISQGSGEEPGAKTFLCAGDALALAPPHYSVALPVGPDRDNARCGIPPE